MKVYLVPCPTLPEGGYARNLIRQLANEFPVERHTLIEDPELADILLFIDYEPAHLCRWIREHPLVKRHCNKVYFFNESDAPPVFLPGVYASIERSFFNLGRLRNYCYITTHAITRNPCIHYKSNETPQKDLLFSFLGGSTSWVRKRLFNLTFQQSDIWIENTQEYNHWDFDKPNRQAMQQHFVDISKRSHFVLCPRGAGLSSIRLFEVMEMGLVPVIIADNWMFPEGPDWSRFSIVVPERSIGSLPTILEPYKEASTEMGQLARKAWEEWFAPDKHWSCLIDSIESIHRDRFVSEQWLRPLWLPALFLQRINVTARARIRAWVLKLFSLIKKPFPYALNR
tara:strand:+ start:50300 stop:51322 length:1023 start_codon:yes stop_codon:yes gene_type:complete